MNCPNTCVRCILWRWTAVAAECCRYATGICRRLTTREFWHSCPTNSNREDRDRQYYSLITRRTAVFIPLILTLRGESPSLISVPSLFPSLPSAPPPLEIAARGSGEARKLPQRSPAAKRILVNFKCKFARFLWCLMTNNFLCLLCVKRKFPWYTGRLIHCPGRKKIRAPNLAAVWGNCYFFLGGGFLLPPFPQIKTSGIKTARRIISLNTRIQGHTRRLSAAYVAYQIKFYLPKTHHI